MLKKLPIILTVFILLFCGCNTEDSASAPVVEAQNWFTKNVTSDNFEVLNYIKQIEWSKSIISSGEKGEIIEVPFTVSSNLTTKVGEESYNSYHRLLLRKSGDNFTYNHVQILTKNQDFDNADKNFNFYQITDNFDGIVLVVNQNKEAVQFSDFKNSILKESSSTNKMVSNRCIYMGWQYENGDFEAIMLVGCFGGGGGEGSGTDNGGYPPHVGGGGAKGSISAPTSAQIAEALQKQIDGTNLDPCTKAVLDKLKNLKQNDIASIFEKFGVPANSTYNLKIIIGKPDSPAALADTRQISKNNYLITISETYVKGTYNNQKKPTDLSIATVMIHEIIHAHFYALFDDYHNNGDVCAYDNFDCLYEKYVSKNYTGSIDAQHAQMFDNYIDKMASILAEFKPGLSSQLYKDLAMSTMFGLKYFDDRYPDGSVERKRILNNRLAENNNAPSGESTPKGTTCN